MRTKFGNAKINNKGYYVITTVKEGNHGKSLHRLIWEEFYGCKIPKGYHIHHRDNNPLNNCILNLQLMRESEHHKLHNTGEKHPLYGKHHSDETRRKISESQKGENHWNYGKHISDETKKKISEANNGENNGMYGKHHSEKIKIKMSETRNTTGYYRVYKEKDNHCKQGFIWRYIYDENGERKCINSVDLDKLKQKVKAKGLLWLKFEKED